MKASLIIIITLAATSGCIAEDNPRLPVGQVCDTIAVRLCDRVVSCGTYEGGYQGCLAEVGYACCEDARTCGDESVSTVDDVDECVEDLRFLACEFVYPDIYLPSSCNGAAAPSGL